jgi:hypothetical protein
MSALQQIPSNAIVAMGDPRDPIHQPGEAPPGRSRGGQFLRLCTGVQNTSALVFSVFLTVHLASPLAAALGGISLADKTLVRNPLSIPRFND